MARLFDDASSEGLELGSSPITDSPVTLACWFNSDSITADQTLIHINRSTGYPRGYSLIAAGAVSGDPIRAKTDYGSPASDDSTTGYSANTWHHAAAVFDASLAYAFIDGGSKGSGAFTQSLSGVIDDLAVAHYVDTENGDSAYLSGSIAEAAVWDVNLTDAEIASLAKGFSPKLIRPQNLVFYIPLLNDDDEDIVSGLSLTATGTPTDSDHPRIIYPSSTIIPFKAATGAASPFNIVWAIQQSSMIGAR